eukprot:6402480-Pyramimonas_sp.AAC.1
MQEHADIVKFASEHPSFELELPLCVEQGIVEMKFIMGLVEDAVAGNHASMAVRWGFISTSKCRRLFMSDQMEEFQKDRPTQS